MGLTAVPERMDGKNIYEISFQKGYGLLLFQAACGRNGEGILQMRHRIKLPHDGIRFREINIPEFHNDIPCMFRNSKGINNLRNSDTKVS